MKARCRIETYDDDDDDDDDPETGPAAARAAAAAASGLRVVDSQLFSLKSRSSSPFLCERVSDSSG